MTQTDRRQARRLDKAFPVFIAGDRGVAFGIARNISDGGLYVESHEVYRIGSTLTITFAFPGSQAEMSVECEVRYTTALNYGKGEDGMPRSTTGMGLRFVRFMALDVYEDLPADPMSLN